MKAQTDVKFNEGVRYSQWVLDSRLGDFYGNTNRMGFTTFNRDLTEKAQASWSKGISMDYVAGLVAKAAIENALYYKSFDWAKPWFKSVESYANSNISVSTTGGSLDNLNAAKMFFGLYTLANGDFKTNASSGTMSNALTQLSNALQGLKAHSESNSFPSNTSLNNKDISGGWFHKSSYTNQMWLDGQYMGPALLAQLINEYSGYTSITTNKETDWDLITKQFTIVWDQCWNENEKLLYHAFSSDNDNAETHSDTWAGDAEVWTTAQTDKNKWSGMSAPGHSAAFWGRAEGWYFLALVDVLEQMQVAGLTNSTNYSTLKGYLEKLAGGIKAKQNQTTGCWYQLINKDGSYSAQYYNGNQKDAVSNYLESSSTAIFTAAYLKAMRLGLLDKTTYESVAKSAYKGLVTQFMKQREDEEGTVDLIGCCRSAGLGGEDNKYEIGNERFRDGSNAYYLLGYDVTPTTASDYTEGKVMGAFVLASTEYERAYNSANAIRFSSDLKPSYTIVSGKSISIEAAGSSSDVTYQWYKDEIAVSGATSSSFAPTESGSYYCVASAGGTTITSSTADVTVNNGANDVITPSNGEKVLFFTDFTESEWENISTTSSNTTVNVTLSGTEITLKGYKNNGFSISNGTLTFPDSNMSTSNYFIAIPVNGINGTITIEINGDAKSTFRYSVDEVAATSPSETNQTEKVDDKSGDSKAVVETNLVNAVVFIGRQGSGYKNINSIKITTPADAESNSNATFNYNGMSLAFAEETEGGETIYAATIELGASKKGIPIAVTFTTADGATIEEITGDTGSPLEGNEIKITAPSSIGEKVSHYYTVTSDDKTSTTKYKITVVLTKQTIVLQYVPNHFEWNTTTGGPINESDFNSHYTTPVLHAYIADENGEATTEEINLPSDITYKSDVESVAMVDDNGNITIQDNANGGAKIYATFSGNDEYSKAETYYNVVIEQGYSTTKYNKGDTAPNVNSSQYVQDDKGNKLVKMTFGGWKRNSGTYTFTDAKGEEQTKTDKWKNAETNEDIASIDGYVYGFPGVNDAMDERMALSEENIYGSKRNGWFKSPVRDANGMTTESYPFTLPVRGSYMTFEPVQNGTLTIYILQNGSWNSDDDNKIKPGEFRPHAFHIVNQRGLTVHEFSPKQFAVSTKQKVTSDYRCDLSELSYDVDDTSDNIARWEEFRNNLSVDEQKAIEANWANGPMGAQSVVTLDNGSFLTVQKGIVKYTFHVTGNETYYFFSNFSKMGFCGANFVPDAESAQPANDDSHKLALSDTEAYPTIVSKENGTIGETGMTNYDFTFDGKELGKVEGVTIPQFYSITLNRTFKKGQWNTFTLPYNMTQSEVEDIFGVGTQIILLDKADLNGETVKLHFIYHEIQNVLPGYPYLIKPTFVDKDGKQYETVEGKRKIDGSGNLTSFTTYGKCINPFIKQFDIDCGDYTAKGTPKYSTADVTNKTGYSVNYKEGDVFISDGNGSLYVSTGNSYGKGYRSYIEKKPNGVAAAKYITMSFSGVEDNLDNTPTEISFTELTPEAAETVGLRGVYNLNGQKVAESIKGLPAGIYIVNGQKYIVK